MTSFSIVRSGKEYVVRVNDESVLRVASRRKAIRLVTVAAELLEAPAAPALQPDPEPSTTCEPSAADPIELP
jgi:hypothetical protein